MISFRVFSITSRVKCFTYVGRLVVDLVLFTCNGREVFTASKREGQTRRIFVGDGVKIEVSNIKG